MQIANSIIENLLDRFRPLLGKDFQLYKNHVYRVYLNCLLIDKQKGNEEKYAIASVFHDLGIWTDHTFDYLVPSIEQLKLYLAEVEKNFLLEEITLMIDWHHKMSVYNGVHEEVVETFRKADWIDLSIGLKCFGHPKDEIKANRKLLPNSGFHWFLLKMSLKNFIRHPFNPLPMFKK
ncbi:MAG: hypothetical protein ABL872_17370 [Lacibacter sp.]